MLAIYDCRFTHQMPSRLKTTAMALGLVRLLQDVGLTDEARTTLNSLEDGFHCGAEKSGTRAGTSAYSVNVRNTSRPSKPMWCVSPKR
jgi:hypothetical protein